MSDLFQNIVDCVQKGNRAVTVLVLAENIEAVLTEICSYGLYTELIEVDGDKVKVKVVVYPSVPGNQGIVTDGYFVTDESNLNPNLSDTNVNLLDTIEQAKQCVWSTNKMNVELGRQEVKLTIWKFHNTSTRIE